MDFEDYYTYGEWRASREKQGNKPATGAPAHAVEDTRTPHEASNPPRPRERNRQPKRRRGRGIVLTICVLVVAFSAVLLAADFLLPNGVTGYVVETFAPAAPAVYAVSAGAYDALASARAASDVARAQGGAGFVAYDGKYNVLLAAYPTREDAEKVAAKHGYTVYVILTEGVKAGDIALPYRAKAKPLIGYHTDLYEKLYDLSDQLSQGGTNVPYCKQRISALRDALSGLAQPFLEAAESATDSTTMGYRSGVMAAIAALNNLVNTDDALFLADMRWTYIMLLRINRI